MIKRTIFAGLALLLFISPKPTAAHPTSDAFDHSAYTTSLDSLITIWHARTTFSNNLVVDTIIPWQEGLTDNIPDSIYMERLANISSPITFTFNNQVKAYIQLYTQRRKAQMEVMLGLSEYYFPIFEAALDARNLPLELKYLPVIESALNPRALSRMGASGIWQFMMPTARQYGLTINSYVDERRCPVKASEAAADFLADLYQIYGDWHLVLAAYNCGPGNVNRAIRRSGGKRDFWEIYYRLPRETRGYVPGFIAATYAFEYAHQHGITARQVSMPVKTDTIMVHQPLHFSQIAEILNLNIEELRELNPQYRRDVIPAQNTSYPVRLAFNQANQFASYEDTIYAHKRDQFFPSNNLVVTPSNRAHTPVAPPGRTAIQYTVRSGDVVGLIAERFNVRAADLRYWNNINRNIIRVGQVLTIYVPNNQAEHYQAVASGQSRQPVTAQRTQNQTTNESGDYIYYTVRSGDNLWTIANQFPGVTNDDLIRLNNITNARQLQPGQRIRIKPKS